MRLDPDELIPEDRRVYEALLTQAGVIGSRTDSRADTGDSRALSSIDSSHVEGPATGIHSNAETLVQSSGFDRSRHGPTP